MINEILEGLSKIIVPIATLSNDERELKDNALRSISNALDETFLYYTYIGKGNLRNVDKEVLLLKYWSAAAIPMKHFDERLSNICALESEYWISPENYQDRDIKKIEIGLDDVRQTYKKILKPNFSIPGRK